MKDSNQRKLVIAVASSALFDLTESGRIFEEKGEEEYRTYQREKQNDVLEKGVAFPFIRRFLKLNEKYSEDQPVEVVLLSKNDPDTGLRVFNSIKDYKLNIKRAGFLNGKAPYDYISAFDASLFLSANAEDVKKTIEAGFPAGTVLKTEFEDDPNDEELRVAFDFDGVIVDDQSEAVYKKNNNIEEFYKHEEDKEDIPFDPGLLFDLFKKLSVFQRIEKKKLKQDPNYKRTLRTAIITARDAPAHKRVVNNLRKWKITVDEAFFLGGMDKSRILEVMKSHIYFDDQMKHLQSAKGAIPSVHIPFGIANKVK